MTRDSVTREEPKLLTDIRDFTTQFYMILRRKFSEWLERPSERDLVCDLQYAEP